MSAHRFLDTAARRMLARTGSFVRALAAIAFVAVLALLLAFRSAKAAAAEGLLGFGGELMQWTQVHPHSGPRTLSVNGIQVHLMTISTPLSVSDTLEHLHALCRQRGGIQVPPELARATHPVIEGTVSRVFSREGVLACLDTGGPLDIEALTQRLGRVVETGDLSRLGDLCYVLARRDGDATSALILWTEGSTPLRAAFPASGDAPGVDPEGCPRRTGSRRLLSAREHGEPYSTTIYAMDSGDSGEVERWYETALAGGGWHVRHVNGAALLAERGRQRLLVRTQRAKSGHVTATVLELS